MQWNLPSLQNKWTTERSGKFTYVFMKSISAFFIVWGLQSKMWGVILHFKSRWTIAGAPQPREFFNPTKPIVKSKWGSFDEEQIRNFWGKKGVLWCTPQFYEGPILRTYIWYTNGIAPKSSHYLIIELKSNTMILRKTQYVRHRANNQHLLASEIA